MDVSSPEAPVPRGSRAVLLIDPHEDTRALYAFYLKAAGCDVELAEDGRDALAKALARPYDAIITETRLPGIDGFELCELLRHDPSTLQTPIIFVTADAFATEARARAVGADAVLVKPCLPELVVSEVRRVTVWERNGVFSVRGPAPDADQKASADRAPAPRLILSRSHRRGNTIAPPSAPPALLCPRCDRPLIYDYSYLGGVSMRHPEQWDYFACPGECGRFEYRQRTRKVKHIDE